jgi:hypothetical protein
MMIRKKIFARRTRRKGRARCSTPILLIFLESARRRAAQKDGQDLPVRQTLPPPRYSQDRAKTQKKREKSQDRNGTGLATVCAEQSIWTPP